MKWVRALENVSLIALTDHWGFWARTDQKAPGGRWRTWLFMGGRGAGKTRAGAEWLRAEIHAGRARRIALVGPTMNDVREVMIAGVSGLQAIGGAHERPSYEPSRRRLVWPNGAVGYAFSAEEPERLRGPQFDTAWVDELAAWPGGSETWDMLQFGLRLGDAPRIVATTTPRPVPLVKRLMADESCQVTRGGSALNRANLSDGFIAAMRAQYGSTRLARQELEGEYVEEAEGALFSLAQLDAARVAEAPELERIVIAVDPPAMAHAGSDACGIVAVGRVRDAAYVLADGSVQGLRPQDWATRVRDLAEAYDADEIIAEANQGGEMVRDVMRLVGNHRAIRLVHARVSKARRAGPVAALYAAGRVHHVGSFRALEDEMLTFGETGRSPDRLDALVWGVSHLLLNAAAPRIGYL